MIKNKKKMSNIANNNKGEITSKDIIITTGITLVVAIIIIVVFIIASNKKEPVASLGQTDITDTSTSTPGTQEPTDKDKEQETKGPAIAVYSGKITQINDDNIVISIDGTNEYMVINIDEDTSIIHQGKILERSKLDLGDSLKVTAEKITATKVLAQQIQVLVSTSPAVPSSINPNAQTDPEGIPVPPSQRKAL